MVLISAELPIAEEKKRQGHESAESPEQPYQQVRVVPRHFRAALCVGVPSVDGHDYGGTEQFHTTNGKGSKDDGGEQAPGDKHEIRHDAERRNDRHEREHRGDKIPRRLEHESVQPYSLVPLGDGCAEIVGVVEQDADGGENGGGGQQEYCQRPDPIPPGHDGIRAAGPDVTSKGIPDYDHAAEEEGVQRKAAALPRMVEEEKRQREQDTYDPRPAEKVPFGAQQLRASHWEGFVIIHNHSNSNRHLLR